MNLHQRRERLFAQFQSNAKTQVIAQVIGKRFFRRLWREDTRRIPKPHV